MITKRLPFGLLLAMLLVLAGGRAWAQEAAPALPAKTGEVVVKAGETAAAEKEPEPNVVGVNIGELLVTLIVFICLLILLRATAWKPILAGLKSRETAIREGIEAAAKARADADRTTRELEAKMAEAQRQGATALAQAKADAVKLADSIRAQAENEAAALKDRALRDIEAAKQQALADINTHAAELGTSIARKILQRNVTVEDQQRLVDESLSQLQASRN